MNVKDGLRSFIFQELRWSGDPEELTDDYPLIDNHVLDSLDLLEVAGYLERRCNIQIDALDMVPENFETLEAIAGMVERKQSSSATTR